VRGHGPLAAQGVALLDAEAVLLVDDDQAQVEEVDVLLEQRMGADDDAGVAGYDVGPGAPSVGRRLASGEGPDPRAWPRAPPPLARGGDGGARAARRSSARAL